MIKEISNNPFRVLGLPANATKDEIDVCYHELIEGLKQQGQSDESIKEIENAYQEITSPEHHWHHASFWFVCVSDKDRHALQYVEEDQYEAAIKIWEENLNYATSHNLLLCYMLMGESSIIFYGKVFHYARYFYLTDNFASFVECVDESDKLAADEAKVFLDAVFSQTTAEKSTLYALLGNKEWMEYVRGKWVDATDADAGFENMRNYINMAEHGKKASDAEESRNSFFKWLWWLLFPVALILYHCYQDSHPQKPFISPTESIKAYHDSVQRTRHVLDMTDSATFNRVNKEMKNMREKHEGEYRSLKEKVELRKNK